MTAKPSTNLFSYATGELSQDAMICWLVAWADSGYAGISPSLHQTGRKLIETMLAAHSARLPSGPLSVKVFRQYFNVDVVVVLNDTQILLIEDKVHTSEHSGQLERYVETVKGKNPGTTVYPVYFKTGDQGSYQNPEEAGYKLFLRSDLLSVLRYGKSLGITSDVFVSYHQHIESIEEDIGSFLTSPPNKWTRGAWTGFFMRVQKDLETGNWSYVSNPSGGFMAYWWGFKQAHEVRVYLQLENESLCIKIKVNEATNRRESREMWYKALIAAAKEHGLPLRKPKRFGNGKTMTVAVYETDYRVLNERGILDYHATLDRLRNATDIVDLSILRSNQI